MTPATGGEVDDLLEPVWSWPERTMLTEPVGEGTDATQNQRIFLPMINR